MTTKVWLIGEGNPYSRHPDDALLPFPTNSAGWRLCYKVLGVSEVTYLERYERANVCARAWSKAEATTNVPKLRARIGDAPYILLGAQVAEAFGVTFVPFSFLERDGKAVGAVWPHPSGRSPGWKMPGAIQKARVMLPLLVGAPT